MAKEIDWETRSYAEELYVVDGLTYEQVAEKTGVAVNTIQGWASHEGWKERRQEYREALQEIKSNTVKLRQNLIRKAAESLNPQDIYAAVRLESVAARQSHKREEAGPDIDRPRLFLEDMEFIAATLQEVDPEGLKILARNFDLIMNRFKEAHEKAA